MLVSLLGRMHTRKEVPRLVVMFERTVTVHVDEGNTEIQLSSVCPTLLEGIIQGQQKKMADQFTSSQNAHPGTPTSEPAQRSTYTDNTQNAGGSGGSGGDGFDQSGSEAQPVDIGIPPPESGSGDGGDGSDQSGSEAQPVDIDESDIPPPESGSGDGGDGSDQSGSEAQPVDIDESGIPTPEIRQEGSFTGNSISGSSFDFVSGDQQRIENNNNQVTTGSYNQHNTYNNNYNHPKAGLGMIIATGAGGIGVGAAGSSLYYNKYWEPRVPRANNMTDCPNLAISMMLTATILSKTKIRVLFDVCRNAS